MYLIDLLQAAIARYTSKDSSIVSGSLVVGLHVLWQAAGRCTCLLDTPLGFTKLRNASCTASIGRLGIAAAAVSKLEAAGVEVVADENGSACFTSL